MQELSRNGHRQRMRNNYLKNGTSAMEDHQVLELFLSIVRPRIDVKPIAYALINRFGSLEGVLNADMDSLMQVDGVGESTAIAIGLVKDINSRVQLDKNQQITRLDDSQKAKEYVKNAIGSERCENVIVITLDNELDILGCHKISDGTVNCANVEPKKIIECVIHDNASSIIIAHNHPKGDATPSAADLNFTLLTLELLRKISVGLNDHIITTGKETISLCSDPRYSSYFVK